MEQPDDKIFAMHIPLFGKVKIHRILLIPTQNVSTVACLLREARESGACRHRKSILRFRDRIGAVFPVTRKKWLCWAFVSVSQQVAGVAGVRPALLAEPAFFTELTKLYE